MSRVLPASRIRQEYEKLVQHVESHDDFELIHAGSGVGHQVFLDDYDLIEVIELGGKLGETVFYVHLEERDDGEPEWARLYFIHKGIAHTLIIESEELARAREDEDEVQRAELERKRELAEELLKQYSNVLSDAQEYRLKHNVEDVSMQRLFQIQDRLQEEKERKEREERIDETLEQELAEALHLEERFNRQFNETDTEMLLQRMGVDFDEDKVRIDVVHRKAKSLLKVSK